MIRRGLLLLFLVMSFYLTARSSAQNCPPPGSNCPTFNQQPIKDANGNITGYAQPMANGANITVNVYGSMGVNPYVVTAV